MRRSPRRRGRHDGPGGRSTNELRRGDERRRLPRGELAGAPRHSPPFSSFAFDARRRSVRLREPLAQELLGRLRITGAEHALHEHLRGLVRAPNERPAGGVREAELASDLRVAGERLGLDVPRHLGVLRRRPEVLADGDQIHAGLAQVGQRLLDLPVLLADAHHDARLGDAGRVALLHPAQHRERSLVAAARVADAPPPPAPHLDAVRPRVRLGVRRDVHVVEAAAEVPQERLDEDVGPQLAQPRHRARHVGGAAVEEVVAIDHRDDHVLEPEAGDRARHVLGLAHVHRPARVARRHRAEPATARAYVAQEHHRGGPLRPALADVGAARLLADRVQIESAEGRLEVGVRRPTRGADLQPRRLGGKSAHDGSLTPVTWAAPPARTSIRPRPRSGTRRKG